jgi:hypothetical protein
LKIASTTAERPAWFSALAPYVEGEDRSVPLANSITLPIGTIVNQVRGVFLRLPKWEGAPFVDDFGKKAGGMVALDGEHTFAELAVLRLLEKEGWSGRWISSWSAGGEVWKYLTDWQDVPRQEQRNRVIEDAEPRQLLARVAGMNKPARYAGCWDLFVWRDSQFAFFHTKRATPKSKETVKAAQVEWLRSALYLGDPRLKVDSFCMVLWDYQ